MPAGVAPAPVLVHELKLAGDGSPEAGQSYVRLPPPEQPYVLRFSIEAGGLACRQGVLYTSLPPPGQPFNRSTFHPVSLPTDVTKPIVVDLWIHAPGVFEFYVEHAAPVERMPYPQEGEGLFRFGSTRSQSKHGYFNVDPLITLPARSPVVSPDGQLLDPRLELGAAPVRISQDAVVMQTFVSKWAGSLSEWAPHLNLARDAGFNMLHFVPLQVRGGSNSPYALANPLDFSPDLFDDKSGPHSSREERFATVKSWLTKLRADWGIASLTDIVLNHVAHTSPWLYDHPELGYSPANSPHLTPAEELDRALIDFSGKLSDLGLPTEVKGQTDIDTLVKGIEEHVLKPLKLWQYYVIDVATEVETLKAALAKEDSGSLPPEAEEALNGFDGGLDKSFELLKKYALIDALALKARYVTKVDVPTAVAILRKVGRGASDEELVKAFSHALDIINVDFYKEYDDDESAIVSNLGGRIKFMRLEDGGPHLGTITKEDPIHEVYFTRLDPSDKRLAGRDPSELALAHNGWVWAADPLVNFASPASRVYLRRELISWSDCVKLRFGDKPEDNPFVWSAMEEYVTSLAAMFDGLRIDNAHSTPIWVGEYLLDAARRTNPDVYVVAELFTGNADLDKHFVSRLGINSLIREMDNATEPVEESRLLYNYGHNKPVGSMDADILTRSGTVTDPKEPSKLLEATVVPLQGSSPHALFMDLTHDNETPTSKRTTQDALTMGALVAFSWSAIGSTRGFDELYPDHLNIVAEKRHYRRFDSYSAEGTGITPVRHVLNHLHTQMVAEGYSEGHLHQENEYIVFHRVHPVTHKGFVLVAHTAFKGSSGGRGQISPIILRGSSAKFLLGKWLEVTGPPPKSDEWLSGFDNNLHDISAPAIREGSDGAGPFSEIVVPDFFPPGAIMVFVTAMENLPSTPTSLEVLCTDGAEQAVAKLGLPELNVLLYRASGEEEDATGGKIGAYNVPGWGDLVYCGLEGFMAPLREVIARNDLGHPLCEHLRQGTWALDYTTDRLKTYAELNQDSYASLGPTIKWLSERFEKIKAIVPPFLRPKYFALIISSIYTSTRARTLELMGPLVTEGDQFTQSLALVAVQLSGAVQSASLTPFENNSSLAAGLPFFAAGWARLWGRDVLIALRGIYLATGLYDLAKKHIMAFGATLHEGMIPNLLDRGKNPRYNCRDGPWYFAQCVQDYVSIVPGGEALLGETVKRRFPRDGEWVEWDSSEAFSTSSTVAELVTEILQRHAEGIHFREHNAGPAIDQDMRDAGFNIDVATDWSTGFVMGGNEWNCGTWQDKNGSSAKAGNKGVPGSPRDGAAVEITGLLKSTLRWVSALAKEGKWPAQGVMVDGKEISFAEWDALVQKNFEKHYYIPLSADEDALYALQPELINRRGIYKDVYGSGAGREWSDYQFRANFPIAMCVAPELFVPAHALTALQAADAVLRAPLGMKTLDPRDWRYRGDYDNANDSDDPSVAKGWNYHNGPEWVFPTGFFLRALLHFLSSSQPTSSSGAHTRSTDDTLHYISSLMTNHRTFVAKDPWAGLPELTNHSGSFCPDSCRTQAWSASTLLDTLREMKLLHDAAPAQVTNEATTAPPASGPSAGASSAAPTDQAPPTPAPAPSDPPSLASSPRRKSRARIQSVETPESKSKSATASANPSQTSTPIAEEAALPPPPAPPAASGEITTPSTPSAPDGARSPLKARISSVRVPAAADSYSTTNVREPKEAKGAKKDAVPKQKEKKEDKKERKGLRGWFSLGSPSKSSKP